MNTDTDNTDNRSIRNLSLSDYDRCTGNTDTCPDMECLACGERECPYSEPMHFHHDGCPLCAEMDDPQEGTSTPWADVISTTKHVTFTTTTVTADDQTLSFMVGTSTPWADTITRLRLRIENACRINDGAELFDDLCSRVRGVR